MSGLRLIQYETEAGVAAARVVDDDHAVRLDVEGGTYALARAAIAEGVSLADAVEAHETDEAVDYPMLVETRRLLPPLTHPDPAHLLVSGTGLTHLGSASGRAAMHQAKAAENLTDSMRMFQLGLQGGKPESGVGVQPEWFYKGDGQVVTPPEHAIAAPEFAQDAGEEPELVGLYLIADDGTPVRLGFALGNEFSDHVTEKFNYLWLAHSKLRRCSFGPELNVGATEADLRGVSRIVRDEKLLWEKPFLTGEANMSHSLANLEHHHFKYAQFRRPGDVHVHFFGTATLSFSDGIKTRTGDRFEISLNGFGRPLRNPIDFTPVDEIPPVLVRPL